MYMYYCIFPLYSEDQSLTLHLHVHAYIITSYDYQSKLISCFLLEIAPNTCKLWIHLNHSAPQKAMVVLQLVAKPIFPNYRIFINVLSASRETWSTNTWRQS